MNGGLFIHGLLVVELLLAVIFCEGLEYKCGSREVYCPKTKKCENVVSTACKGKCKYLQASCDKGTKCYQSYDRCDGVRDCDDGVDESHCTGPPDCDSILQKRCNDGTCYYDYQRCDNYNDCHDGSDEENCPSKCWSLTCNNGDCYSHSDKCDGVNDCSDGTDEFDCPDDSSGIGGLSSGAIAGIAVGAVCLFILIACCKKAMRESGSDVPVTSSSAAYHSAANYRQAGNFQSSHHYNNGSTYPPGQTDSTVRQTTNSTDTPYPVSLSTDALNPAAGDSAFQSTHNYNNNTGSSIPPLPPNFVQPTAPAAAPFGTDGANRDYGTAPYPVPEPSPVAAPPPSYESLYPENK